MKYKKLFWIMKNIIIYNILKYKIKKYLKNNKEKLINN